MIATAASLPLSSTWAQSVVPALNTLQAPPVDPFTLNSDAVTRLMTDAGIL